MCHIKILFSISCQQTEDTFFERRYFKARSGMEIRSLFADDFVLAACKHFLKVFGKDINESK